MSNIKQWSDLPMSTKAKYIRYAVALGLKSVDDIRNNYDEFILLYEEGGNLFAEGDNLRNPLNALWSSSPYNIAVDNLGLAFYLNEEGNWLPTNLSQAYYSDIFPNSLSYSATLPEGTTLIPANTNYLVEGTGDNARMFPTSAYNWDLWRKDLEFNLGEIIPEIGLFHKPGDVSSNYMSNERKERGKESTNEYVGNVLTHAFDATMPSTYLGLASTMAGISQDPNVIVDGLEWLGLAADFAVPWAINKVPKVAEGIGTVLRDGVDLAEDAARYGKGITLDFVGSRILNNAIDKGITKEGNSILEKQFIDDYIRYPENSDMFVHLDHGNNQGYFSDSGAFIKDSKLYPGQTINPEEQSGNFIWFGKDRPYGASGIKKDGIPQVPIGGFGDNSRIIVVDENAGDIFKVRDSNRRIGQWPGLWNKPSKGPGAFVRNDEFVSEGPVDLSRATILEKDPLTDIWSKVRYEKTPQIPHSKDATTISWYDYTNKPTQEAPNILLDDAYMKAVQEGDMETAQALRDLHFVDSAPNSVLIDENGNPILLYHGTPNEVFDVYNANNNQFKHLQFHRVHKGNNIFMTDDPKIANMYGDNIIPLYANMKFPGRTSFTGSSTVTGIRDAENAVLADKTTDGLIAHTIDKSPYKGIGEQMQYAVKSPNQIKSSLAITYFKATDPEVLTGLFKEGDVIPLSMRDNFNRNDIRFGLVPFAVPTIIGLGLSNK